MLLPDGLDLEEVRSQLRFRLFERSLSVEDVLLSGECGASAPIAVLNGRLQFRWKSPEAPRTISNLDDAEIMADVLHIEGLESLSREASMEWINFCDSWFLFCQRLSGTGRFPGALCIITFASHLLPTIPNSSVNLAVHWWWGFPSSLEIRLLCRMTSTEGEWNSFGRWREYLLPSLAGGDLLLADYLWDKAHGDQEDVVKSLRSFAEQRNWNGEISKSLGQKIPQISVEQKYRNQSLSPPPALYPFWAYGVLNWSPEYGTELSSAALAVHGDLGEIQHRLWRGQAELLLPVIDSTRLILCMHLTRLYGSNWPTRWKLPIQQEEVEAVRKNPLSCQLGHLRCLLKNYIASQRCWIPLVDILHSMRNRLAHYYPVAYQDFEELCREIEQNVNRTF